MTQPPTAAEFSSQIDLHPRPALDYRQGAPQPEMSRQDRHPQNSRALPSPFAQSGPSLQLQEQQQQQHQQDQRQEAQQQLHDHLQILVNGLMCSADQPGGTSASDKDPGNPRSKSIESDVIVSATRVSPKHSCASQNQSSPGGSGSQVQVRRSETLHDVKQLLEPSLNDAAASVYPLDRAASMVSSHPPASPDAAIANGVADVSQSVRRVGVASGSAASAGFSALDSQENKETRRKLSNREAARRSRLRKQVETELTARAVRDVAHENELLTQRISQMRLFVEQLTSERVSLMQQVLQRGAPLPDGYEMPIDAPAPILYPETSTTAGGTCS